MNKLIIALIAGTFAATAAAQMPAPSEKAKAKQDVVKEATKVGEQPMPADNAKAAKMNTEESKKVKKLDRKEKAAAGAAAAKASAADTTGAMTAADAAKNTKISKGTAKELPTKMDKQEATKEVTKAKASQ
jgi:hypothetical protein